MASFKINDGIQNYIDKLEAITDPEPAIKYAVYEGAKIVADEVKKEISALPVYSRNGIDPEGKKITQRQKDGMLNGFGISAFQNNNGFINVKLGFNGYNRTRTDMFPNGQPNAMIARSICSGTSFRAKNDFIGRALTHTRKRAEQAMSEKLKEFYDKKMNSK